MKIMIICSKRFYSHIPEIQNKLEKAGHEVYLPNCIDNPNAEAEAKQSGTMAHEEFKATMYKQSEKIISGVDAVLVINYTKDGVEGYIGGATFLEMYDAFRLGKKIYMIGKIPEGILKDEIIGFSPSVLRGDISYIA